MVDLSIVMLVYQRVVLPIQKNAMKFSISNLEWIWFGESLPHVEIYLFFSFEDEGFIEWSLNGVGCTLVMDIFYDKWGFFDTWAQLQSSMLMTILWEYHWKLMGSAGNIPIEFGLKHRSKSICQSTCALRLFDVLMYIMYIPSTPLFS